MPVDTFVENTWYVAGRSSEFAVDEPQGRVVAGRPVLVWRTRDGNVGAFDDRGKLLRQGEAVGGVIVDILKLLADEPRNAHHEELVQVITRYREKTKPFEQRVGMVARLVQHALVEGEPAQFTVEIAIGGRDRRDRLLISDNLQIGRGAGTVHSPYLPRKS